MSAQPDNRVASPAISPWGTAAQRANLRRDKRDAVLRAAAQLFRRHGFAETSLDQIAAQLGISKPTLYYYVPCKASLVQACAELGAQQALYALQLALKASQAQGRVSALHAYAQAVATDYGWCMVRADEYVLDAPARKQAQNHRQAIEAAVQPLLAPGLTAAAVLRALEGMALSVPSSQWMGVIHALATTSQPHSMDVVDAAGLAPEVQPMLRSPSAALGQEASQAPVSVTIPDGKAVALQEESSMQPEPSAAMQQVAVLATTAHPAKVKRSQAAARQQLASQSKAERTQISLF